MHNLNIWLFFRPRNWVPGLNFIFSKVTDTMTVEILLLALVTINYKVDVQAAV